MLDIVRGVLVSALSVIVLAACGAGSAARHGCSGLPTARHTSEFLVLFGHTLKLTKRFVCTHFGAPNSIRTVSGNREVWTYGNETITFRGNRAIGMSGTKVPIGS